MVYQDDSAIRGGKPMEFGVCLKIQVFLPTGA
jgi:hypothetical protein